LLEEGVDISDLITEPFFADIVAGKSFDEAIAS
jgi:hypothetical protein